MRERSGGSCVFALILGWACLSSWRKKWVIDDTPTSTCRGVFTGRNELTGSAQPLSPDAARRLYGDPKRRWLCAQVRDALDERELFTQASAAS